MGFGQFPFAIPDWLWYTIPRNRFGFGREESL